MKKNFLTLNSIFFLLVHFNFENVNFFFVCASDAQCALVAQCGFQRSKISNVGLDSKV